MEKLTQLERALLQEFESLAATCASLAKKSETTDQELLRVSEHFSARLNTLMRRQSALEERLDQVTEALNRQTASTQALIDSVNRLIAAQRW